MVHWPETINKVIGSIPFVQAFYSHFWDEHIFSHHKTVATDEDPVSHPLGTSSYVAVPKAFIATHRESWNREVERISKIYNGNPSFYAKIFENKMVYYQILHAFILFSIYQVFGIGGLKAQMIFVSQGILWTEMINYIEHYGLRRKEDQDGIPESIGYMHSWSALASPYAFKIQRHADHHAHKFRPYHILRRFERSPTLPYEYILMLYLALVPPVFFYIMDPMVKSINDATSGIYNPDKWNNEMPYSEADLKRRKNVGMFISFVSALLFSTIFL